MMTRWRTVAMDCALALGLIAVGAGVVVAILLLLAPRVQAVTIGGTTPALTPVPLSACTAVIVTLHSYTRGEVHTDGCLVAARYNTAGLVVVMRSADNLDGGGIFRNGFER